MLWPDPAQRPRITEILDNLTATRISEAEREGWLGEIEGVKISLAGANDKLLLNIGTPHVYALKLQYNYAGLGVNMPCLYADTSPASVASCSAENSDKFLQFRYVLT